MELDNCLAGRPFTDPNGGRNMSTTGRADFPSFPGKERAEVLLNRHNTLNRSAKIVAAILGLARHANHGEFNRVHDVIKDRGGFLMKYDLAKIEYRLSSPYWLTAEAGYPPLQGEPGRMVADCQCYIPPDDPDAPLSEELHLPIYSNQDYSFFGEHVTHKIWEDRACAGVVADLCVEDDFAHQGFAGAARRAVFRNIVEKINPGRKNKIRYMLAEIFSIRGIIDADGEVIELASFHEPRMHNFGSLSAHFRSHSYPAMLGWFSSRKTSEAVAAGRRIDGPLDHGILADWFVMIHDLEAPPAHPRHKAS